MDRVTAAGALLLLLSTVGYAVATVEPYPGRAATLPGLMVGVTLLAVGGAADHDVTGVPESNAAAPAADGPAADDGDAPADTGGVG